MRDRLVVAFIALALLVVAGAGTVRAITLSGQLEEVAQDFVALEAPRLARALAHARETGAVVDEEYLAPYAGPRVRLTYSRPGAAPVVLSGAEFDAGRGGTASATVLDGDATLLVERTPPPISTQWGGDWQVTAPLLLVLVTLAALIGFLMARWLSAPFRRLAVAAAALGRGRLDLDLPATTIPEARAIADALAGSAQELRCRLERERKFTQTASHQLRTPLTGLRLRLEDTLADPASSPDAREVALEALRSVGRLSEVVAELVDLAARDPLVSGAVVPLTRLAQDVGARWSTTLAGDGRGFGWSVQGEGGATVTPGPLEQALDLLLAHVRAACQGPVRMVWRGEETSVEVALHCTREAGCLTEAVETVVAPVLEAVGGRAELLPEQAALRLRVPRR
ncbi:sensor histidine kinase [Nocardioides sp.]|uniref:sensor histidine kinase n=1 Tax=Nocardioides sp. TaxID=35761 RepID=UPI0035174629